jgi:hypothetical protein
LKAIREKKQITYKGKPIKIIADFSTETLKARRAWTEVFWTLKENNFTPRIPYPEKLLFKIEGRIKIFHNKKNKMLSFTGKWMELENIILSEVSLAQKTKNPMFSLICGH